MKNPLLKTILLVTAVILTALPGYAQKDDEVKSKIEKINKEMAEAMVNGNTEAGMKYYAEDAISMPAGSKMIKGKEEIRKSGEEMMKSGVKIQSFETNIKELNTYGDMIQEIGEFKIKMRMPGMEETWEETGKYLTMWEKQPDGSLKIKTEIWNTNENPMQNTGLGMGEGEHMEEMEEMQDVEQTKEMKE